MELVPVAVHTHRGEAEIAAAALRAEGIDAVVVAENEGGLNPGFYRSYGVTVSVRPGDVGRAEEILGVERIALPVEMARAMVQHARFALPEEACGLLAGDASGLRMVYPTTNLDHAVDRFTVDPQEHLRAWKHAERNGWSIVGAFHSHPRSDPYPSSRDVAGALDPEWLYVIVGRVTTRPRMAAFRIRAGRVTEVRVDLEG